MKYVYIHGFNSAGYGDKINDLKANFGEENVIALNLPYNPEKAIQLLEFLVDAILCKDKTVLLGTSLGGFYSLYLSYKFKIPAFIINPAIDPYNALKNELGEQTNFKTGERYNFTDEYLENLKNFYLTEKQLLEIKDLIFVYLDEEDELLDSKETKKYFEKYGIFVKMYPNGNHRFTHMKELIKDLTDILQSKVKF